MTDPAESRCPHCGYREGENHDLRCTGRDITMPYRQYCALLAAERQRDAQAEVIQRLRERLYARMTTCCDQISESCAKCAADDALLTEGFDAPDAAPTCVL